MTRPRRFVLAVVWLWLGLFLFAPLVVVLKIAVSPAADGMPPYAPILSFTPAPHIAIDSDPVILVLTDPLYRRALLTSLRLALISTLACLLVGYPMALAIARAAPARRTTLLLLVMLPFWTGFLMRLNAWIGLLNDGGWVPRLLVGVGLATSPPKLLYTDAAIYIGMVYAYLPFMVLPLYASLSRQDPALLDAAADLYATRFRRFLRVTLPLSAPGIAGGVALVFIPCVGEYVIPELLGSPGAQTIGRAVWTEFFDNHDWPTASALAMVLLAILLAPIAVARAARR